MTDFKAELLAEDGTRIALEGEQQVGRTDDSDIVVDDPRVSRKHAVIRVADQGVTVEDLGSANGTTVNGSPASGAVRLSDGDVIAFDKHRFTVAIAGGAADDDATVVGGVDATQVDSDATVVAPVQSPAPEPPPAATAAPDLPGSWVNSGTADSTRVMSMEEIDAGGAGSADTERASDLPHVVVLDSGGARAGVLELQTGGEQDVWEIGREDPCEIKLNDPSVSERHAQLIHQDGRWRVVNLVSTNGIFVNGEKVLTAYLGEGDTLRLGTVTLVFHAAKGAPAPNPAAAAAPSASAAPAKKGGATGMVIAALVILVAAVAAYLLL